jgi:hypothetical protein
MYERWDLYNILVGKPKGKRPLGRHRHILEGNIEMEWDSSC